jgi:serine/threonine protein kinase
MKLAVNDTPALALGRAVRQFAVVDCLGVDLHTGIYRAQSIDTEHPVLLMEYLPAELVERRAEAVHPVPGAAERYKSAISRYASRLRDVAELGHPAIPMLDDIWQDQGTLYAVGPWQGGRSLLAELADRPSWPDPQLLQQWARAMCDALTALHRQQLLHGNLVMHMFRVRQTGELILPLPGGDVFAMDVPPCMAPEQHPLNSQPGPVGPWSDVYQLSAVMYHLMTGAAPPTVLRRWEGAPLQALSDKPTHWPAALLAATQKGLSMHHDARPQSVEEWLDLAGLPDRRTRRRHELDPAAAVPLDKAIIRGPGVTTPTMGLTGAGFADSKTALRIPRQGFDDMEIVEEPPDEIPIWVWLCLGVAVAAFISILIRTL